MGSMVHGLLDYHSVRSTSSPFRCPDVIPIRDQKTTNAGRRFNLTADGTEHTEKYRAVRLGVLSALGG